MPRFASRFTSINLEIRKERLLDISEEDAKAEGVEIDDEPCDHIRHSCESVGCLGQTYKSGFCLIWDKLHGAKDGESWTDNPEVYVLSYTGINKNIDKLGAS